MSAPTHDDAVLMLQLARLQAESGCADAADYVWSDEFIADYGGFRAKYGSRSPEGSYVRTLSVFYETVGTLVKHRLLNEDLILDWLGVGHMWNRLEGHLLGARANLSEPHLWENFEGLALRALERDATSS